MLTLLRDGLLDALALVLPVECAGCGAPDRPVCARCRPALEPDPTSRRLADGMLVFSGLDYDGIVREVILGYKEHGRVELARALAPALAEAVRAAGAAAVAVDTAVPATLGQAMVDPVAIELVAVPGSRRARRRRGFDPVGVLVARAGLDRARVCSAARPHPTQKTLSLEQRGEPGRRLRGARAGLRAAIPTRRRRRDDRGDPARGRRRTPRRGGGRGRRCRRGVDATTLRILPRISS